MRHDVTGGNVYKSISAFPITILYLTGVAVIVLIQRDTVGVMSGIFILGFLTMITLVVSVIREMRIVHNIVAQQHDELTTRINQLTDVLEHSGIAVPHDPSQPKGVSVHG